MICIICNERESISEYDNTCADCLSEFAWIDLNTLPEWIKQNEMKIGLQMIKDLEDMRDKK